MRREIRLRRGADFERVRANRRSWSHPLLICTIGVHDDDGLSRIGIIVGRRVGKAVTRNRVKRRIREAGRAIYPDIIPGHDIVLIARPAAAAATALELQEAVASLLARARLRRAPTGAPPPELPS
jgi:ribonuclease P protein component